MKDQPIKTGTLSILIVIAVISLAVLSILAYQTSRADYERSREYADATTVIYQVEAEGESWRASVDEVFFTQNTSTLTDAQLEQMLPDGTTVEDGVVKATFTEPVGSADGTATLTAELARSGSGYEVRTWTVERTGARSGESTYESIL